MQRGQSKRDRRLRRDRSPVRNAVFCPSAYKSKLLFETKEKADRYMELNADDIRRRGGYAPVRSYPCTVCGGWHVTSQADREMSKHRRDNNERR